MSGPRVYVAGGEGLLGGALRRAAGRRGYPLAEGTGDGLALGDASAVDAFFVAERPDWVIVAGGRSAGIGGNQAIPADLMEDNLRGDTNVLTAARRHGVGRLLYLAPACVYPRECPQPMRVEHLMTGPLEPTSEAYSVAKLAGLTLTRALRRQHGAPFLAAVAANPFGLDDDFGPDTSHVIPALIGRMHAAKRSRDAAVTVWGTGRARREFIFGDDLADACLYVMERYDGDATINLGGGGGTSVAELAGLVREVVGYDGEIRFDPARPDGAPMKVLDSGPLAALGWRGATGLRDALAKTYDWYLSTTERSRGTC